jgi:hypothetical protein
MLAVLPETESATEQRPTIRASHKRHFFGLFVADFTALIV